jgi:3-methyladenine DNA glycosylase AlkC
VAALKSMLDRKAIGRIARRVANANEDFDAPAFARAAASGLGRLELKARVRHVAQALREQLDPDYETALAQLLASLPPPLEDTEELSLGFDYWPFCQLVEDHGADHVDASLDALRELTCRFSAEFAIRPLLVRDPERTLRRIRKWLRDPNPHVRRLCSEGTRPRLPWGTRLREFQQDPSMARFVLERLVDDPELYVRRSVANHLGDVAKDHPEVALEIAEGFAKRPSEARDWVIRHALRGPIKAGDARALALVGFGAAKLDVKRFQVSPRRIALGETVELSVRLSSRAKREQTLLVDYAVHFRKKDGSLRPKVFRWGEFPLAAGETLDLAKRHAFRQVTTRVHHPGAHAIELKVNGASHGRRTLHVGS